MLKPVLALSRRAALFAPSPDRLRVCALDPLALQELPCGDDRKALIALAIKRETTVPLDWLGSRLHMGTRSTVSRVTAAMALKIAKDKKLARQHHLIVKGAS